MSTHQKQRMHEARAFRTRSRIKTGLLPRLSVFRSGRHIYAQLIDDDKGVTLASASDLEVKKGGKTKAGSPQELAAHVGALIAERCKEKKIERVVFDRGGYLYHGRVKSLAEGARKGGLKF